jgi:hypothetical protein
MYRSTTSKVSPSTPVPITASAFYLLLAIGVLLERGVFRDELLGVGLEDFRGSSNSLGKGGWFEGSADWWEVRAEEALGDLCRAGLAYEESLGHLTAELFEGGHLAL